VKITDVKAYLVHPENKSGLTALKNWLFVKVQTDQGITGWGEGFTIVDREPALARMVEAMTPYLKGRDPFRIKEFIQLAGKFADGRGSVDIYGAVSSLEQAMWDIVGKALGAPVYNLLGGPCRDKILVYANGWTSGAKDAAELARRAAVLVERGFKAIKFYPFPFGRPTADKAAVENVRAVREAVGSDIALLIDVWRRPDPGQAIRVARMLEPFDIYWYEEPVPSDNLDVLAEVRAAVNLPVVTGECLHTKFDFREVLEKRAADIINPDVASCGGILQLKEIAAMAEPYYVLVSPHNYNSTALALAATVQAVAVMPNFNLTEFFVSFSETSEAVCKQPLKLEDGCILLPTSPGLGIEIDEAALGKYPYARFPQRRW